MGIAFLHLVQETVLFPMAMKISSIFFSKFYSLVFLFNFNSLPGVRYLGELIFSQCISSLRMFSFFFPFAFPYMF